MSNQNTLFERLVNVPAGQPIEVELGVADFLFFKELPDGLLISINDQPPVSAIGGLLHKAQPGSGNFRRLALINPTGGALTARVFYGQGDITIAGAVTLVGSIPLPGGAATAAHQITQTAHLATLATATPRTAKLLNLTPGSPLAVVGARQFSVFNKSTTLNLTITLAGEPAYVMGPREGLDWPLLNPHDGNYQTFTCDCPVAGAGVVSYVL